MKKLMCLTVAVAGLALVVSGCSESAPTTPNEQQVVLQPADEATLPLSASDVVTPGYCCPDVFVLDLARGDRADHNGDSLVCRKQTPGGAVTIDNNTPGDCYVWTPGNCCPDEFELIWKWDNCNYALYPYDRNGDDKLCRKIVNDKIIIFDNDPSGDCYLYCVPPCGCGGGV